MDYGDKKETFCCAVLIAPAVIFRIFFPFTDMLSITIGMGVIFLGITNRLRFVAHKANFT